MHLRHLLNQNTRRLKLHNTFNSHRNTRHLLSSEERARCLPGGQLGKRTCSQQEKLTFLAVDGELDSLQLQYRSEELRLEQLSKRRSLRNVCCYNLVLDHEAD